VGPFGGILPAVPALDLIDETFIVAAPERISVVVHDPERWRQWWPDLELRIFMDRAERGIRWSVSGSFTGSNEIWLEPVGDGTLVHYFLRLDPADGGSLGPRRAARVRRSRALSWKRWINALKDELEAGRAVGMPAAGSGSSHTRSVPSKPE